MQYALIKAQDKHLVIFLSMSDRSRFAKSNNDIRGFFRPVGKIDHDANLEIQQTQEKLRTLKETQTKVEVYWIDVAKYAIEHGN